MIQKNPKFKLTEIVKTPNGLGMVKGINFQYQSVNGVNCERIIFYEIFHQENCAPQVKNHRLEYEEFQLTKYVPRAKKENIKPLECNHVYFPRQPQCHLCGKKKERPVFNYKVIRDIFEKAIAYNIPEELKPRPVLKKHDEGLKIPQSINKAEVIFNQHSMIEFRDRETRQRIDPIKMLHQFCLAPFNLEVNCESETIQTWNSFTLVNVLARHRIFLNRR